MRGRLRIDATLAPAVPFRTEWLGHSIPGGYVDCKPVYVVLIDLLKSS
jgi:hypothetical protein